MEHTKEPWHSPGIGEVCDQSGRVIAICIDCNPVEEELRPDPALDEGDANARRIVACINACAGLDTEKLEQQNSDGGFPMWMFVRDVVAQRDELLAALEALLEEVAGCYCTTEAEARAVIQKVRGGE